VATREKSVCFAFPMTTALVADAVVTNLSQISLYIPEASPTFTSVFVEVGFQDAITATGGTITEHRCGLRLGAAGYTTVTETDDIANSGENIAGVLGPFDFTSHFAANWTGTSMTCDLQVYFDQTTGTTLGMNNVTALVYVTYTYDDAAATQIKTVALPMESLVGALPTVANSNFGTNQIPQLTGAGGLLPEAGVTIRDWFIVIEGNESTSSVTDWTMSANIDGGSATTFMNQEAALASDRFCRWIYRPSVPSTTAAHNFQLWASVPRANHVTATLYVTYEFTLSGTSRVLNSIMVPIEIASPLGLTTTAEASRFRRAISVQEPGTITLRQSAFRINYNTNASITSHRWRMGGQVYRAYTPAGGVVCGMFSVQQRLDAGAAQGAGVTLARGFNDFVIDGYSTNATVEMTNISGCIILNYESDLASDGIGAHSHTVRKVLLPWNMALSDLNRVNNFAFAIPEANYWVVSAGFQFIQWVSSASMAVTFDVECLAGEGKGAGYYDIYADAYVSDAEMSCSMIWMRGRDTFKRFPLDADADRLDIETARDYRLFTTTATGNGMLCVVTYHSHIFEAAGDITGNDAALPTEVRLIHADSGEMRQVQTLVAGDTSFNFAVNDNTDDYYITAYQDGTHVGRSGLAQAV
jgi:hypothetical protein